MNPRILLIGLSTVCACSSPKPRSAPIAHRPVATVSSSSHIPLIPAPAPASTASSSSSANASGNPVEPCSLESRKLANGSTNGTIACGTARCQVNREICVCFGDSQCGTASTSAQQSNHCASANRWTCVPVDAQWARDVEFRVECDDASDCSGGQACCETYAGTYGSWCTARTGRESGCQQEICAGGDSAPCPKGQTCIDGKCLGTNASSTCGKNRCPKAQPICIWSKGSGRCVTKSEAQKLAEDGSSHEGIGLGILECVRPSDCGTGLSCCATGAEPTGATFCTTQCDPGRYPDVCSHDADCPAMQEAPARRKCDRSTKNEWMPPSVGFCITE